MHHRKISKNHVFRICTDIQVDFEMNRPVRYQNTVKRNYCHRRQTDGRTDSRTDRQPDGQTDVAYDNNRNLKKIYILKTLAINDILELLIDYEPADLAVHPLPKRSRVFSV